MKDLKLYVIYKFLYNDKNRVVFVTEHNDSVLGGYECKEEDENFFKNVFRLLTEGEEHEQESAKDILENSIRPLYQFKKFLKEKIEWFE